MAAYLIADTDLFDPAHYEEYKVRAKAIAEKYSGQYLARGGQLSVKESDLWSPTRLVIVRFDSFEQANKFYDSFEQANKFYDSPEYQAILHYSKDAAKRTVVVLEGI